MSQMKKNIIISSIVACAAIAVHRSYYGIATFCALTAIWFMFPDEG